MPQVTVRNVESDWIEEVKKIALKKDMSMNGVFLEMIAKALGKSPEQEEKPKTNGLERFAGAWNPSPEEVKLWDEAMEECSRIDEELWK